MRPFTRNPIELELIRRERRKQESAAKTVPYISFILTHVALVLFLGALFLVDRLITNPTSNLTIKVVLVAAGVITLATEWAYAIISSVHWKRDILALQQAEEEQRRIEDEARRKLQEAEIAAERQKSLSLMFDLQMRRRQERQLRPGVQLLTLPDSQPSLSSGMSGPQITVH
jgi:hypothetical protein